MRKLRVKKRRVRLKRFSVSGDLVIFNNNIKTLCLEKELHNSRFISFFRFSTFGIYIIMMTNIIRTLVKVGIELLVLFLVTTYQSSVAN